MTNRPPSFTSDLAVVYLARYAEGPKPIHAFIKSYEQHRAGTAHDLVVLRKGTPDAAIDRTLAPYLSFGISLPDEGVDMTAYALAAARLPHRLIVFLNSFSEIASDDWLAKLRSAYEEHGIGIAGATGSYESPRSSMRRLKRGLFLAQRKFSLSPTYFRGAFQFVRRILPKHFSRYLVNKMISRITASAGNSTDAPDADFEVFWARETRAEGRYEFLQAMPDYPNPHLRTNGFIIDRHLFLESRPSNVVTKESAYLYECGPNSLTRKILSNGKKAVVVGRDGMCYDVEAWPQSRTFRLQDQANLLIHDNQTRAFEAMNRSEREAFSAMTWGDDHLGTG
jgi:hypothetical protein